MFGGMLRNKPPWLGGGFFLFHNVVFHDHAAVMRR